MQELEGLRGKNATVIRQMRLRNARWRDTLDEVYTLFPRLLERRQSSAGWLSGRRSSPL